MLKWFYNLINKFFPPKKYIKDGNGYDFEKLDDGQKLMCFFFIRFLKLNNAFRSYKINTNYNKDIGFSRDSCAIYSTIDCSFPWAKTKEGYDYWWQLDKKWKLTLDMLVYDFSHLGIKKHPWLFNSTNPYILNLINGEGLGT